MRVKALRVETAKGVSTREKSRAPSKPATQTKFYFRHKEKVSRLSHIPVTSFGPLLQGLVRI